MIDGPLADPAAEGRRIVEQTKRRGLTVRVIGGAAVSLRCPVAATEPLARTYKDVDVVARRSERAPLAAALEELGYRSNSEFNVLQGGSRLLFWDDANGRQLDVLLDRFEMCHALDFADRLALDDVTLPSADLLLMKLQVRETNERDFQDAAALFIDGEVDDERVASVLASDWGWWRTATEVLDRVAAYAAESDLAADLRNRVDERIAALRAAIEREPKGVAWKLRAKVGDRVRWYEEPEDDYEAHI